MTLPLEAFTSAPVMVRAPSEARKAATRAVSAAVERRLRSVACSNCDTEFELRLKMAEMEEPLSQPCPECTTEGKITQQATAAAIGDPIRLGVKKPDAGWNDVLQKVKSAHPGGNWNNKKYSAIAGR